MPALSSNRKPAPAHRVRPALGRGLRSAAAGLILAGTGALALGALGTFAGATTITSSDVDLAAAKTPTCSLVTPTEVKNALDVAVGRPKTQHSGNVTACFYPSQGDARAVTIRLQTQTTKAQFAAARRQFQKHDGQTTTVTTLGDQAYSAVIPAGPPTQYTVYAIAVLHNSTALLVTAVNPVPLNAEEALAKKILPSL